MHRISSMDGEPSSRAMIAVVLALVAVILVIGLELRGNDPQLPSAAGTGDAEAGRIRFLRDATTEFDPYITGSTPATQKWMREHYWRMRGYPPFFDQALSWAPPSEVYDDLYAIYRNRRTDGAPDARLILRHPDWVLRDTAGEALYIPFNCSAGACPQYAADIGNPEWRRAWIERALGLIEKGYAGVFIDDVNLQLRVSDGEGNPVDPIDPRTGLPMTTEDWRRYVAAFMEEIRAALPDSTQISENLIWYAAPIDDPSNQRTIEAADYIQLERGFSDPGIVAGNGGFGYESLLAFIDGIHALDKSVIYKPYLSGPRARLYELAGYFLAAGGEDAISAELQADPNDWWHGWETDLGAPRGPRFNRDGLLRRDFEHGIVVVNEPGEPPRRFDPGPRFVSIDGSKPPYLIAGGEGQVVVEAK